MQLGIPVKEVELIYRSYWSFIKSHLAELDVPNMNEEDFKTIITNFSIPYIGKLYTNYDKVLSIKRKFKHVRAKKNQTDVQSGIGD